MQARVRGLQDIKTVTNSGQRKRLETLNELAQLQREKVRLEQEKKNWQKRIDSIEARLEQVAEKEKWLQQWLVEADRALDEQEASGQERSGAAIMHEQRASAEGPAHQMTIRY